MSDLDKHMPKNYFFDVLEKRLREYEEAIFGTKKMPGMKLHITTALLHNIQEFKKIDSLYNLFGSFFWGYGINNICDGYEEYSNPDVFEIKKIGGLNKHHESYRNLLLLTFKVEKDSLFLSTFSIDSCGVSLNSNVSRKYDLRDFENAQIKKRPNSIIVEFVFKSSPKPIHFQIDTYHFGGYNLSSEQLAKYYFDNIKILANEAKNDNTKIVVVKESDNNLNQGIDNTENRLRNIVADALIKSKGKEDFESLLTGEVKSHVKNCIKEYVSLHPNMKESDFISIGSSIQFFNIEHLKKTILKDENWQYFEQVFKEKEKVNKYFEQFNTLRKAMKHNRKVTELISLEGKAAMEWFEMIMKQVIVF